MKEEEMDWQDHRNNMMPQVSKRYMTNKILEAYQKEMEEFKKEFGKFLGIPSTKSKHNSFTDKDMETFMSRFALQLLEGVREGMPEAISNYKVNKEIKERQLKRTEQQWASRASAHGFNSALQTFTTPLDEAIKQLTKDI